MADADSSCAHVFLDGAACPKCGMSEHDFEMEFYGGGTVSTRPTIERLREDLKMIATAEYHGDRIEDVFGDEITRIREVPAELDLESPLETMRRCAAAPATLPLSEPCEAVGKGEAIELGEVGT